MAPRPPQPAYPSWPILLKPDMARPIEGRHLHFAGWVAGTFSFHGLDFEIVTDENGNPTNALLLRGGPENTEFSILIPEPPQEWPAAPSMPL